MKKLLTLLSFVVLAMFSVNAEGYTVKEIPNVHIQDVTRYVSNPDDVFSMESVVAMDSLIAGIWEQTSAELVVVAVDSIDDSMEENEFATALFEHWGIGKRDKDNGVLVLLVKNLHRVVIRTGYGVEGILPDIICGRVIRKDMIPYFKNDDYDGGMLAGLKQIEYIMTTPGATEELMSQIESEKGFWDKMSLWGQIYFSFNIFFLPILLIMFLYLLLQLHKLRPQGFHVQQELVAKKIKPFTGLTIFTLGVGLPILLYIYYLKNKLKNAKEPCPKCKAKMERIDDARKSAFLNDNQKFEEKIGAAQFHVWKCGSCGGVHIIPVYSEDFKECPKCHAHTVTITRSETTMRATRNRTGAGIRYYECKKCQHQYEEKYRIARLANHRDDDNYGSSRGGHSGGSFGGGRTGGGGASGGW